MKIDLKLKKSHVKSPIIESLSRYQMCLVIIFAVNSMARGMFKDKCVADLSKWSELRKICRYLGPLDSRVKLYNRYVDQILMGKILCIELFALAFSSVKQCFEKRIYSKLEDKVKEYSKAMTNQRPINDYTRANLAEYSPKVYEMMTAALINNKLKPSVLDPHFNIPNKKIRFSNYRTKEMKKTAKSIQFALLVIELSLGLVVLALSWLFDAKVLEIPNLHFRNVMQFLFTFDYKNHVGFFDPDASCTIAFRYYTGVKVEGELASNSDVSSDPARPAYTENSKYVLFSNYTGSRDFWAADWIEKSYFGDCVRNSTYIHFLSIGALQIAAIICAIKMLHSIVESYEMIKKLNFDIS